MPGSPWCGERVTFTILPAAAARDHRLGGHGVAHQPGALHVQPDHRAKALRRDVLGRGHVLAAGVVHEHVDLAVALEHARPPAPRPDPPRGCRTPRPRSGPSSARRRSRRAARAGGRRPPRSRRRPRARARDARPSPEPPPDTIATCPSSRPGAKIFEGIAAGGYPPPDHGARAASGAARARAARPPRRATSARCSAVAGPLERRVGGQHALGPLLGELAEARRLVHGVADHRVLEALLGADVARHRRARRHADARVELGQLCRHAGRAARARPPARRPRASSRPVGAPNTQSAASPSNLFTQPPCRSAASTTSCEERVQQRDDLRRRPPGGQRGGADEVHEQHGHVAHLAAQPDLAVERGVRHVAAHVPAEEVAQPLALGQPGGHAVEAGLELADLAAVVDGHARVELALLDRGHRLPAPCAPDRPPSAPR